MSVRLGQNKKGGGSLLFLLTFGLLKYMIYYGLQK